MTETVAIIQSLLPIFVSGALTTWVYKVLKPQVTELKNEVKELKKELDEKAKAESKWHQRYLRLISAILSVGGGCKPDCKIMDVFNKHIENEKEV